MARLSENRGLVCRLHFLPFLVSQNLSPGANGSRVMMMMWIIAKYPFVRERPQSPYTASYSSIHSYHKTMLRVTSRLTNKCSRWGSFFPTPPLPSLALLGDGACRRYVCTLSTASSSRSCCIVVFVFSQQALSIYIVYSRYIVMTFSFLEGATGYRMFRKNLRVSDVS